MASLQSLVMQLFFSASIRSGGSFHDFPLIKGYINQPTLDYSLMTCTPGGVCAPAVVMSHASRNNETVKCLIMWERLARKMAVVDPLKVKLWLCTLLKIQRKRTGRIDR